MKKGIIVLAAAIVIGILAFILVSNSQPKTRGHAELLDSLPELSWLRTDLKLTDEQYAEVEKLHRDYRPVCAEMCHRIAESESAVAKIAGSQVGMSTDLTLAIENHGRVIANCKRSMLEHIYQTAALMNESQSRRYLEVTLPLALDSASSRNSPTSNE